MNCNTKSIFCGRYVDIIVSFTNKTDDHNIKSDILLKMTLILSVSMGFSNFIISKYFDKEWYSSIFLFVLWLTNYLQIVLTDSDFRLPFQSKLHTIVVTEDRVKGRHYKFVKRIYFCLLNIEQRVGIINLLRDVLNLLLNNAHMERISTSH